MNYKVLIEKVDKVKEVVDSIGDIVQEVDSSNNS